jgi:hypothetical protein
MFGRAKKSMSSDYKRTM